MANRGVCGLELESIAVYRGGALPPLSEGIMPPYYVGQAVNLGKSGLHFFEQAIPDIGFVVEFPSTHFEHNVKPYTSFRKGFENIRSEWERIEQSAATMSCQLWHIGIHPTQLISETVFNRYGRYDWLYTTFAAARQFIPATTHFLWSAATVDEALALQNFLRGYLPHFLSLSLSCPFFEGTYVGKHSFRGDLWREFGEEGGVVGIPDIYNGWNAYQQYIQSLVAGGIIDGLKSLWQWLRSRQFDNGEIAVEMRICDAMPTLRQNLATSAFGHGLAAGLFSNYDMGIYPALLLPSGTIEWGIQNVELFGLDGLVVDPLTHGTMSVSESIQIALDWMRQFSNGIYDTHSWLQSLSWVENYIQSQENVVAHQMVKAFQQGGTQALLQHLFNLNALALQ